MWKLLPAAVKAVGRFYLQRKIDILRCDVWGIFIKKEWIIKSEQIQRMNSDNYTRQNLKTEETLGITEICYWTHWERRGHICNDPSELSRNMIFWISGVLKKTALVNKVYNFYIKGQKLSSLNWGRKTQGWRVWWEGPWLPSDCSLGFHSRSFQGS